MSRHDAQRWEGLMILLLMVLSAAGVILAVWLGFHALAHLLGTLRSTLLKGLTS